MTTGTEANEFLMRCSCGDKTKHIAWLIHEPDDSRGNNLKGEQDDWYLMMALEPRFEFWRRAVIAFRYLFGIPVQYWGYSELVLRNQDVDALAEFICRRRNIVVDAVGRVHG